MSTMANPSHLRDQQMQRRHFNGMDRSPLTFTKMFGFGYVSSNPPKDYFFNIMEFVEADVLYSYMGFGFPICKTMCVGARGA
jgi:hypothetical protein